MPSTPPPVRDLQGWTVEQFAAAAGIDRIEAVRMLYAAMRRSEVIRMQIGERVLWARLGDGMIHEVVL